LIQSNLFNLSKKLPKGKDIDWHVVIMDATEIPVQRPKAVVAGKRRIPLKYFRKKR
jgi:hypothetical protein